MKSTTKIVSVSIAQTTHETAEGNPVGTDYQVTVVKSDGSPANCLFSDYSGTEEGKQKTFQKALDFAHSYIKRDIG